MNHYIILVSIKIFYFSPIVISAITSSNDSNSYDTAIIIGIVIAGLVALAIIVGCVVYCSRKNADRELKDHSPLTPSNVGQAYTMPETGTAKVGYPGRAPSTTYHGGAPPMAYHGGAPPMYQQFTNATTTEGKGIDNPSYE